MVGFGARFELEPEVVLMDDREFTLSVFSTLSLGLHGTWIDDDIANDDFVANGGTYGGEAGVRMQMGDIIISSALVINNTTIRESSSENGIVIPRLDTEFLGFQVTMGIRF